jgi:hypothetical protein
VDVRIFLFTTGRDGLLAHSVRQLVCHGRNYINSRGTRAYSIFIPIRGARKFACKVKTNTFKANFIDDLEVLRRKEINFNSLYQYLVDLFNYFNIDLKNGG